MLMKMTIKNFRSYKDENTILLTSTSKINRHPEHERAIGRINVLKFAGIYGDNASGKTNILKAANFIKMFVGYNALTETDFAFKENEGTPSFIEMVFSEEGFIYQYGLEFIKKTVPFPSLAITNEYLNIVGTKEIHGKTVYSLKNGLNEAMMNKNDKPIFAIFLNGYKQLNRLMRNHPFLNYINGADKAIRGSDLYNHLSRAYSFFKNDLVILGAASTNMVYIQDKDLSRITAYTQKFDPSIEDIKLARIPNDEIAKTIPPSIIQDIVAQLNNLKTETITLTIGNNYFFFTKDPVTIFKCETLLLKHRYISSWFHFYEESEGTKKFIILMSYFSNKNAKKTYCVDELERSMHPSSSEYILRFFDQETEKQDTQFIFTTHYPAFMKTSLRRDEIYFTEKDMYGVSAIYPLTDFNTTTDSNLPAMFLKGVFRKIPENGKKVFEGDTPAD